MKKMTFSFGKLFYNNRFSLIFSIVMAVVIWLSISMTVSPTVSDVLSEVPVNIPLENTSFSNLKAFGNETGKVQVTIQGKKYVTSTAGTSDVIVNANVGQIVGPGQYTLELTAQKTSSAGDFDIISISPSTVVVRLDYEVSVDFDLEVETPGVTAASDDLSLRSYIADSSKNKITLTGAKSEISQVKRAVAVNSETLLVSKTTSFPSTIRLYDADGEEIELLYSSLNYSDVDIIVSVQRHKTVPLTVTVQNGPTKTLPYTIYEISGGETKEVEQISILGETTDVDPITGVSVGTVDFSKISSEASSLSFDFEFPVIEGISFTEYSSATPVRFRVVFDSKRLYTKTFDVDAKNIIFSNVPAGSTAAAVSSIKGIMVMSTSTTVTKKLTANNIVVTVDCSKLAVGTNSSVPVRISFAGYGDCWAVGEYTVSVKVS
ncbi:MAG: hypothetical protein IJY56_03170 [Clostridia bacterium]|nr:hypothetical protein [Clostridia bacterium]